MPYNRKGDCKIETIAGLFGWPFALAFFASSIVLGILGGLAGDFMDQRGWLKNQTRYATTPSPRPKPVEQPAAAAACTCERTPAASAPAASWQGRISNRIEALRMSSAALSLSAPTGEAALSLAMCCDSPAAAARANPAGMSATASAATTQPAASAGACSAAPTAHPQAYESDLTGQANPPINWREVMAEIYTTGKRLRVMFLGFTFIGNFLNNLIPAAWVGAIFGQGHIYSVPLAATLGLPLYINTKGSRPLVRALIDGGMSQGAALAFLISGAGTSVGAVAGALTIARWRVITLVIGTLWAGAILMGFLYNGLLATGVL